MIFPTIKLTESVRRGLALVLFLSYVLGIFTSFLVIGDSMYIKFVFQSKVSLTEGYYDNNILPCANSFVGILHLIVNIIGAVICIKTYDVGKRTKTIRRVLQPYMCFSLFGAFGLFSGGLFALFHVETIHVAFHSEFLLEAMKRYKMNKVIKNDIDRLQMDFQCCGSENYYDWFHISWISSDLIDIDSPRVQEHLTEGEYINDDVPFSCCDGKAMRTCIHHFVLNDSKHFHYHHLEGTTLNEHGCLQVLLEYFTEILQESAYITMAIVFLALLNIVLLRFLQTSVYEAIDRGQPECNAPGWLFNCMSYKGKQNELYDNDNARTQPLLNPNKIGHKYNPLN